MATFGKPKAEPNTNTISDTFNINDFKASSGYVTYADLVNYANLHMTNIFTSLNVFVAISTQMINGITAELFDYIRYLPNLITTVSNVSYDAETNTTTITDNTYLENVIIQNKLLVGANINANNIMSHTFKNNNITTNQIKCKELIINNVPYQDIICYVYINGLTMPINKSMMISEFNFPFIKSMYFTLKSGCRLTIVDNENNILFSFVNRSDNYKYYEKLPYKTNWAKIKIFNKNNKEYI